MSHRRPLTVADRYMSDMEDAHPTLRGKEVSPFDSFSRESSETLLEIMAREGMGLPGGPTVRDGIVAEDGSLPSPQELSLWSNWRATRQVYRFDRALSAELARTPCPDDMPLDALRHLPHRCLFVEVPCDMPDDVRVHEAGECPGFFCWYDRQGVVPPGEFAPTGAEERISLVFLAPGRGRIVVSFSTEVGCLGESIERVVTETAAQHRHRYGLDCDIEANGRIVRALLSFACAHLLYIVADNSDQRVEYRPSGNARRRPNRHTAATIHSVGARVGRALGKPRVRYVGGARREADGGRTVATHVRAGHWHRYWRGPKADPSRREVVVHWIAPLVVNAGRGEDLATVIHDAR